MVFYRWCEIGDAYCTLLAESLKINTTLKKMDLRFAQLIKIIGNFDSYKCSLNKIGNTGCTMLAESLKINKTIQEVYLGSVNVRNCVFSVLEVFEIRGHDDISQEIFTEAENMSNARIWRIRKQLL